MPDLQRRGPVGSVGSVGLWACGPVGPVGLEPTTYGLKVRSSAIELEAQELRNPARPEDRPG